MIALLHYLYSIFLSISWQNKLLSSSTTNFSRKLLILLQITKKSRTAFSILLVVFLLLVISPSQRARLLTTIRCGCFWRNSWKIFPFWVCSWTSFFIIAFPAQRFQSIWRINAVSLSWASSTSIDNLSQNFIFLSTLSFSCGP